MSAWAIAYLAVGASLLASLYVGAVFQTWRDTYTMRDGKRITLRRAAWIERPRLRRLPAQAAAVIFWPVIISWAVMERVMKP